MGYKPKKKSFNFFYILVKFVLKNGVLVKLRVFYIASILWNKGDQPANCAILDERIDGQTYPMFSTDMLVFSYGFRVDF